MLIRGLFMKGLGVTFMFNYLKLFMLQLLLLDQVLFWIFVVKDLKIDMNNFNSYEYKSINMHFIHRFYKQRSSFNLPYISLIEIALNDSNKKQKRIIKFQDENIEDFLPIEKAKIFTNKIKYF